jgi:hypothetical protein
VQGDLRGSPEHQRPDDTAGRAGQRERATGEVGALGSSDTLRHFSLRFVTLKARLRAWGGRMVPNLRACVANIVARLHGGHVNGAVYDHTQREHIHVSGSVNNGSVNVYDHGRSVHITGTLPNLYDHGTSDFVSLTLNGKQFSGYDFASGEHYNGNVTGSTVTLYDFESGEHHFFNV